MYIAEYWDTKSCDAEMMFLWIEVKRSLLLRTEIGFLIYFLEDCTKRVLKIYKSIVIENFELVPLCPIKWRSFKVFVKLCKSSLLTIAVPCIFASSIEIKIKLNIYFHTSLWCLKRFYEGLWPRFYQCLQK